MSIFENMPKDRILYRNEHFTIVYDKYPVTDGHCLVVSNEIRETFFDLTDEERIALPESILKAREIIESKHDPDGYNIGMNCGQAAGQTVFHFHCHVIPRYTGDVDNPKGGVRGVIPNKRTYS